MLKMVTPKHTKKYKHKDEDAWLRENPGKEFKPFDPERDIDYSEKRCASNDLPPQSLKKIKSGKIYDPGKTF